MMAKITAALGESFYLDWQDGKVVADFPSDIANLCTEYLNGTPAICLGDTHEGTTDGHYKEERRLRTKTEFLLIVGSLAHRFDVRVDLVGELADSDHEEILSNPAADAAIAKRAIRRAMEGGMSREDAIRLYGSGASGND